MVSLGRTLVIYDEDGERDRHQKGHGEREGERHDVDLLETLAR